MYWLKLNLEALTVVTAASCLVSLSATSPEHQEKTDRRSCCTPCAETGTVSCRLRGEGPIRHSSLSSPVLYRARTVRRGTSW